MKHLNKQIMMILLGLSVIIMTVSGNALAAETDAIQSKGKLDIAEFLYRSNQQPFPGNMLLARLLLNQPIFKLGSGAICDPTATASNAICNDAQGLQCCKESALSGFNCRLATNCWVPYY